MSSNQLVSYIYPSIRSIQPLIGSENGGSLLTIEGHNFTIGNGRVSVFIGHRSCSLQSISDTQIRCETSSFPASMLNENHPIKIFFDQQTKLIYEQFFSIVPNPILHSFDRDHRYESFRSGGHRLVIVGKHLHAIQNVQLEFQRFLFVSPLFRNGTHLIFLTPSSQELQLHDEREIEIALYLDNFNRTSSLLYNDDPIVYPFEPMLERYTHELIIHGVNLTAIGHTASDISVQIGCDPCHISHLESNRILCQPPTDRPKEYSVTNQLCYNSEHPSIIVHIDNIRVHVGYLLYPRRIIIFGKRVSHLSIYFHSLLCQGILGGCLFTLLLLLLVILLVLSVQLRLKQQKRLQRYFHANGIDPQQLDKEQLFQNSSPMQRITLDPSAMPVRSYLDYLQLCYLVHSRNHRVSTMDAVTMNFNQKIVERFQLLIETNDIFVRCLFNSLIKSDSHSLVSNLILTQRFRLSNLLQVNHDVILFHICILTSHQAFLIHRIPALFAQLYSHLKLQIHQGPIDALDPSYTFYSLNYNKLLHEHSLVFKAVHLTVHLDSNENLPLRLLNVTCLTCDTISQVKGKILHQFQVFPPYSTSECELYLIINQSCSSSSSSASSSVPLTRKALYTEVSSHRTMKYSTTIANNDANYLLLNDIDTSSEQISDAIKLNTLKHYGILADGYELRMVLLRRRINSMQNITKDLRM